MWQREMEQEEEEEEEKRERGRERSREVERGQEREEENKLTDRNTHSHTHPHLCRLFAVPAVAVSRGAPSWGGRGRGCAVHAVDCRPHHLRFWQHACHLLLWPHVLPRSGVSSLWAKLRACTCVCVCNVCTCGVSRDKEGRANVPTHLLFRLLSRRLTLGRWSLLQCQFFALLDLAPAWPS